VLQAEKPAEIKMFTIVTDQIQEELIQVTIETQQLAEQIQTEVTQIVLIQEEIMQL
jgi:hypothetical protein